MASSEDNLVANTDGSLPSPTLPKPTPSEVHACQFSSWYTTFRNIDPSTIKSNTTTKKIRKNVTIESIIIRPLPSEFIEYLLSDGVRLPECATKVSSCMNDAADNTKKDDKWDTSSDEGDVDDGSSHEELKKYTFPELTNQIQVALTTLGGNGCIPKLNWSSPKDATWMNCGSLKCTKVGDIYLLLKSSDFIGFDLEKAWDDLEEQDEGDDCVDGMVGNLSIDNDGATKDNYCVPNNNECFKEKEKEKLKASKPSGFEYELVLRKWCNLHPSMEFRCFVYDHELVGISQRHPSKFYPHLQPPTDGTIHPSADLIQSFFETYIQNKFSNGRIHRYVIDLYIDSQERVWIVDFNVWATRTDGLLFDWEELALLGKAIHNVKQEEGENQSIPLPEMRVVTKDMKSMTYDPLSSYRGPTDVMDLLSGGGGGGEGANIADTSAFQDFMKQCVKPSDI